MLNKLIQEQGLGLPELLTEGRKSPLCGAPYPAKMVKDRIKGLASIGVEATPDQVMDFADLCEPFGILWILQDQIRLAGLDPSKDPDSYFMSIDSTLDQNTPRLTKKGAKLVADCEKKVKAIAGTASRNFITNQDLGKCKKIFGKMINDHFNAKISEGHYGRIFGWSYGHMSAPFTHPSNSNDDDLIFLRMERGKFVK